MSPWDIVRLSNSWDAADHRAPDEMIGSVVACCLQNAAFLLSPATASWVCRCVSVIQHDISENFTHTHTHKSTVWI